MNRWLLSAALLAACGDKKRPSAEPIALPVPPQPADAAAAARPRQLVTALVETWDTTQATLQLWTRSEGAPWQRTGESWPAVVGRSGTAWGSGIHDDAARSGPRKQEGDGKSPAGMFEIRASYGYATAPPAGTKLPYTPSNNLECIDDPSSELYTQIVDGSARDKRAWTSSEQMRRSDELYTWVVDLAHNPSATPKGGSCIFLHVWSGPQSATVGCTAMDVTKLEALMQQLDPVARPVFVLLPRADYQALATAWDLPPL